MRLAPRSRSRRRVVLATGLSVMLVAAACSEKSSDVTGGDEEPTSSEPAESGPDASGPSADASAPPTNAPTTTVAPVEGGRLVIGGEAEVGEPWTPANVRCESNCYQRALTFYDTLTVVDENGDWQPFLAESMEPNQDYTKWTITLRKGIEFHDGTPLNADAAIFNLNQHATSVLTAAALADIARDPNNPDQFLLRKVDERTFTVQTGHNGDANNPVPLPRFPYGLTKQVGFMASPTWLRAVANGNAQPTKAVGTGPFTLKTFRPDDRMVVAKNPNYWMTDAGGNQLPYLNEIEFVVIPDSQARQAALESGDIDMLATSDGQVVGELLENDQFVTEQQTEYTETAHILLHVGKPNHPLNSKQVRCALVQGLDRDTLLQQQTDGVFTKANSLFSEGQEGYLEDSGLPEHDPEAARQAIQAYESENGPVEITYSTTSTTATQRQAEFVKAQWEAIGVDVNIETVLQAELIINAATGADVFEAFGWRNHAGIFVDQQLYWWHSRNANTEPIALNFGRMRDKVVDRNLELARSSTDRAERQQAAETINRRMSRQCYHIPTWRVEWGVSHVPEVAGLGQLQIPGADTTAADGAGFPGQVWLTTAFLAR